MAADPDMADRARALIARLELVPHPEGGFYRETYRAAEMVYSPRVGASRHCLTDIYFLLLSGQISRFHRVHHDELWHFHEGAPLELCEFNDCSQEMRVTRLDPAGDPPCFRHCVVGGLWQAAVPCGDFSLVSCTVAPGFDFADFSFLADSPEAVARLRALHPGQAHLL